MKDSKIIIMICLAFTMFTRADTLPTTISNQNDYNQEKTAVYIPQDVEILPLKMSEEILDIKGLKSEEQNEAKLIFLREDEAINNIGDDKYGARLKANEDIQDLPLSLTYDHEGKIIASTNADHLKLRHNETAPSTLKEHIAPKNDEQNQHLLVPQVLSNLKKHNAGEKVNQKLITPEEHARESSKLSEASSNLSQARLNENPNRHVKVKRQAPGPFVYYRPVFRYRRVQSGRRRVSQPSRGYAMVGFLSDRDSFPTVA